MQSCLATTQVVEDTCKDAREEAGWEVKHDGDTVTIKDDTGTVIYSAIQKGEGADTWLVWYSTQHFEMFDPPELDN